MVAVPVRNWKECLNGYKSDISLPNPSFSTFLYNHFERIFLSIVLYFLFLLQNIGCWELESSVDNGMDKWFTWAGVGYVKRSLALRMKMRNQITIANNTYSFRRLMIGPSGPMNQWGYEAPNTIGT